jgi:hypothetical protein
LIRVNVFLKFKFKFSVIQFPSSKMNSTLTSEWIAQLNVEEIWWLSFNQVAFVSRTYNLECGREWVYAWICLVIAILLNTNFLLFSCSRPCLFLKYYFSRSLSASTAVLFFNIILHPQCNTHSNGCMQEHENFIFLRNPVCFYFCIFIFLVSEFYGIESSWFVREKEMAWVLITFTFNGFFEIWK